MDEEFELGQRWHIIGNNERYYDGIYLYLMQEVRSECGRLSKAFPPMWGKTTGRWMMILSSRDGFRDYYVPLFGTPDQFNRLIDRERFEQMLDETRQRMQHVVETDEKINFGRYLDDKYKYNFEPFARWVEEQQAIFDADAAQ